MSLVWHIPRGVLEDQLREACGKAVQDTGAAIITEMKREITEVAATGALYITARGPHRASAPGEPPANDTGELASSISGDMVNELTAVVSIEAPYAATLELGGVHMLPRPFVLPAVQGEEQMFPARIVKQVQMRIR